MFQTFALFSVQFVDRQPFVLGVLLPAFQATFSKILPLGSTCRIEFAEKQWLREGHGLHCRLDMKPHFRDPFSFEKNKLFSSPLLFSSWCDCLEAADCVSSLTPYNCTPSCTPAPPSACALPAAGVLGAGGPPCHPCCSGHV